MAGTEFPNWQKGGGQTLTADLPLDITADVISIPKADTNTDGYLSSVDWNTFSTAAGGGISALSGDVTTTVAVGGVAPATVIGINNVLMATLGTGILKNTTITGAPSIAIAADFPTLNQNTTGVAAGFTGNLAGDVTGIQGATVIGVNAVNFAKFQQLATVSLVGNSTGGTANAQTVTLSANMKFTGTTVDTVQPIQTTSAMTLASLTLNTGFKFSVTPTVGYFLQTDALGNASWADVASAAVISAQGTVNQVLINGSTSVQTGALVFTTPQDIGTSSAVRFGTLAIAAALLAGSTVSVSAATAYGVALQGTSASVVSTNQYGFYNSQTFAPTSGSAKSYSYLANSIFAIPTSQTTTTAASFVASPLYTGNAGTITSSIGFYYDGGGGSVGSIAASFGGFFTTPAAGTLKIALFSNDLVVGSSSSTAAPTNGARIGGNVIIGSGSASTPAALTINSTTQGIQPSSLTTSQKNSVTATEGLFLYDNVLKDLQFWNGTSWVGSSLSGVTTLQGTNNQINPTSPTSGSVTISLSSTLILPGTLTLGGNVTGASNSITGINQFTTNQITIVTGAQTGYILTCQDNAGLGGWTAPFGILVTGLEGTPNQILVDGTSGSFQTGNLPLTLANGINIGSYQANSPVTGGITCPGAIGSGTPTPTAQIEALSASYPPLRGTRTSSVTNAARSATSILHLTSGDMVDGFSSLLTFDIQDNAGVANSIGDIGAVRSGADNTGSLIFRVYNSGTASQVFKINQNGGVGVGSSYVGLLPPASGMIMSGNFGVGTASPLNTGTANLTVGDGAGGTSYLIFNSPDASQSGLKFANNISIKWTFARVPSTNDLLLYADGSTLNSIYFSQTSAAVTIGSATPNALSALTVKNPYSSNTYLVNYNGSNISAKDGVNAMFGVYSAIQFTPPVGGASNIFHHYIEPNYNISTGLTVTTATGLFIGAIGNNIVGNITTLYGLRIGAGPIGGSGTIGTQIALKIDNPTNGTAKYSMQCDGNASFFGSASFGSGTQVIFIGNTSSAPSGTPTGGGLLYVDAGALKYKGSSGTVSTVAPA